MVSEQTHRFLRYWFPVLLYCLIIFIQSSYPIPEKAPSVSHLDKFLHFAAYGFLGMLFLRGFRHSRFKHREALIRGASILLAGIYGATDELHQYFVPMRFADVWDLLFDCLGGFFGVYIYQRCLDEYPRLGRI